MKNFRHLIALEPSWGKLPNLIGPESCYQLIKKNVFENEDGAPQRATVLIPLGFEKVP